MLFARSLIFLSLILCMETAFAKKALDYSSLPESVREDLVRRLPYVQNEKIGLSQVDEVIRFLQQKSQFNNIQVIDEGGNSPYQILFERSKRITDVRFTGNKNLSTSEVESLLSVKAGDSFDQQSLIEGGERIRRAYEDKGFMNAIIDIEMPPEDEDKVGILIRVNENRRSLIHNVLVQSANDELNDQIVKELSRYLNKPYTDEILSQISDRAEQYFRKKRYIRAELMGPRVEFNKDESQATLRYRIDKPESYTLDYGKVSPLKIREVEKILDLDSYSSASPALASELAQKIRASYLEKGYARAEVKSHETATNNRFNKKISFDIEEGPRIKIEKIHINGRYSRNEKYYINTIKEHSSKLIANGYYNKEEFEVGLKNLGLEMQNNGYLQAKVLSSRTQYNKAKDGVSIFVNLDEGPLTNIQRIEFIGNNSYSEQELLKVIGLSQGALKLYQIEQSIGKLKSFYQDNGYIEMSLLNEREDLVTYEDNNTQAYLKFQILEGPRVRASSIIIEGNSFTRSSIIERELEFSKDELLTPYKIEESIARLQRTGFFSSVEIATLEEKTAVADRTVVVKVTERDPGLINLGFGATNERNLTLRGYVGASYRNLLGTGRGISLRLEGNYNVADIKYLESRIVFGYLEPYLFNTRVRGRLNISRSSTVTDYDLKKVSEVNSTTYSLEKDFTSHILGIWDLWSLATIRDYSLEDKFPSLTQDIASMGPTIDLDFRDNPFNPTRGTFTRWAAEYASPDFGSSKTIEYWRTTLSFTQYNSIGTLQKQPVVWANQVRGGYLKNMDPEGGVPWDKKGFTLGGQATIRGYEAGTQEVFPNRADLGLGPNDSTYFLSTQATMFIIKSEVRFPVWESLGGALFYDGGSVKIDGLNLPDNYRDSAGFGIRYNTPVGPLSLDWAWKLDARPNEEPWRFHLSIGTF